MLCFITKRSIINRYISVLVLILLPTLFLKKKSKVVDSVVDRQLHFDHIIFIVNLYDTNITTDTSAASFCENSIKTTLLLRSDVYPKSTFIVNFSINPKVKTWKFCVGDHCHIFQLNRTNTIPTCLHAFIKDRLIEFPGLKNLRYSQYLNWTKHTLEM